VVVSLLRVLTKATLPDTPAGLRRSADLYFLIAALVCGACTAVYGAVLPRLPSLRQYRRAALEAALRDDACGGGGAAKAGWEAQEAGATEAEWLRGGGGPESPWPPLELSSEDPQRSQGGHGLGSCDAADGAGQQAERGLLHELHAAVRSDGSPPPPSPGCGRGEAGLGAERSTWAALPVVWPLAAALVLIYG
jgi:hypothetical protein